MKITHLTDHVHYNNENNGRSTASLSHEVLFHTNKKITITKKTLCLKHFSDILLNKQNQTIIYPWKSEHGTNVLLFKTNTLRVDSIQGPCRPITARSGVCVLSQDANSFKL